MACCGTHANIKSHERETSDLKRYFKFSLYDTESLRNFDSERDSRAENLNDFNVQPFMNKLSHGFLLSKCL